MVERTVHIMVARKQRKGSQEEDRQDTAPKDISLGIYFLQSSPISYPSPSPSNANLSRMYQGINLLIMSKPSWFVHPEVCFTYLLGICQSNQIYNQN